MQRNSGKRTVTGPMSRFLRSDRGNATLITVLAAIPVVAAAGMAIDYSRGVRSANELQQVADAAALAAASGKNVTGASASEKLLARKTIAQNYLDYALPKVSDVEIIGTPAVTVGPNTVGNPPDFGGDLEVEFSRYFERGDSDEEEQIHGPADHGGFEAGGSRHARA